MVSPPPCEARPAGLPVTVVVESAEAPGGKMRSVPVDGTRIEAGPTVFTMRWVFDELLAECGTRLEERVRLRPASLLARHAWSREERLDLHADIDASAGCHRAIRGGRGGRGYRRFCARAAEVYRTLEGPFIRLRSRPGRRPRQAVGGCRASAICGASSLRDTLVGAEGVLPRSARCFSCSALRHLLRRLALYRARDADAGIACGAGGRLDRGRGLSALAASIAELAVATGRSSVRRAGAGGAGLGRQGHGRGPGRGRAHPGRHRGL